MLLDAGLGKNQPRKRAEAKGSGRQVLKARRFIFVKLMSTGKPAIFRDFHVVARHVNGHNNETHLTTLTTL